MKKFKVSCWNITMNVEEIIEEVNTEKETNKCVILKGGRRVNKMSREEAYLDTRKEAIEYIFNVIDRKTEKAKEQYEKQLKLQKKLKAFFKEYE